MNFDAKGLLGLNVESLTIIGQKAILKASSDGLAGCEILLLQTFQRVYLLRI